MIFKVIIFQEYPRTNQFLLQNIHKIQQIFWVLISDIVYGIRRNR